MISTRATVFSHLPRRVQYLAASGGRVRDFTSPAVRRYQQKQKAHGKPSLDIAKAMPNNFSEMDNHTLITVAAMEIHPARIEVLKRHIMSVDDCSYDEASATCEEIAKRNREGMYLAALPYYVGIGLAVGGAFGSIPMVFDLKMALSFNDGWVTTDVPEPKDLETALEVGSWTWNWMEPPLGTFSFFLLCLQFSRAQMGNLGIRPYTSKLKRMRAGKLVREFPQYDPVIIHLFCETDPLVK